MLFQPRTLNQIRRKPGLVDPVKCRDVVCHLNAPVQEGALRPDAGKQHGEQRAEDHVPASPQCGGHIARRCADHNRERNANQQRLIRFLAKGQPSAKKHRHRAPQQHERKRDQLQLQGDKPKR